MKSQMGQWQYNPVKFQILARTIVPRIVGKSIESLLQNMKIRGPQFAVIMKLFKENH